MSEKQQFLETWERERETTMRVLRAYPQDKADLRVHPKLKTAKDLAFVFALECYLGTSVLKREFKFPPAGGPPSAPDSMAEVLAAVEQAQTSFGDLLRGYSDAELKEPVQFLVGPKQVGDIPRIKIAWAFLHDQIHHRGQFSVYLRIADAKVPSIYGPTADEPWV